MDGDGYEFEMVAASLRATSADAHTFLPVLAAKLSGALPGATAVKYTGGLLKKKQVAAIDVDLGDERFHIEELRGGLSATVQQCVRGIVLKNEPLPLDAWIDQLSRRLAQAASQSEVAGAALKNMLEST